MASTITRKGNRNCCVINCKNTSSNTGKEVHFYKFPPSNNICKTRREKWIHAVKRINVDGSPWIPSKSTTICSEHFVGGIKSEHPHHPAYNPSIFPHASETSLKEKYLSRFNRLRHRELGGIGHHTFAEEKSDHDVLNNTHVKTSNASCQTDVSDDRLYTRKINEKTFSCSLFFKENYSTVDSAVQNTFNYEIHSESLCNK